MASKKISIDLSPQGPITFKREVKIPTPDGKPLAIEFGFKARTRLEMAELQEKWGTTDSPLLDEARAAMEEAAKNGEKVRIEHVSITKESIENEVPMLLDILTEWNLDIELSRDSLTLFVNRYPGAFATLTSDYRESINQGRVGNSQR